MKEVEKDYEGKVEFFKMDVDHNPQTSVEYGIRGIPTVIVFKGGEIVSTTVGGMSRKELVDLVNGVL
jgi:thioredoxin 1